MERYYGTQKFLFGFFACLEFVWNKDSVKLWKKVGHKNIRIFGNLLADIKKWTKNIKRKWNWTKSSNFFSKAKINIPDFLICLQSNKKLCHNSILFPFQNTEACQFMTSPSHASSEGFNFQNMDHVTFLYNSYLFLKVRFFKDRNYMQKIIWQFF